MERKVISTGRGMPPTGPFVQAIKVGNFLDRGRASDAGRG